MEITLSSLSHTWLLDLDGTILKHNGYLTDKEDSLLAGAKEFLDGIPEGDQIVFLTSRKETERERTETFLTQNKIPFDHIIYGLPYGERILINDKKPSGLKTALAVNVERDKKKTIQININKEL